MADRLGRRLAFLIFAIGAAIVVFTYTMIPFGDSAMLFLGFPLGFFAAGVFSGMGAFYTENFPTRVRGVGQGFAYNLGRALGALFPAKRFAFLPSPRMALWRSRRSCCRKRKARFCRRENPWKIAHNPVSRTSA